MSTVVTLPVERPTDTAEPSERGGLYRLSVEQYGRMIELGILGKPDRVVLLEGLLVARMTKYPPHTLAIRKSFRVLQRVVPPGWFAAKEDPISTLDSMPEPDLSIVRGEIEDYGNRQAFAADLALVVEVADSSLRLDLTVMKRIYAAASIPYYWVVNIPDHRLEHFSDPTGPGPAADYRKHDSFGPDESIPLVINGREVARIAVRDLLP